MGTFEELIKEKEEPHLRKGRRAAIINVDEGLLDQEPRVEFTSEDYVGLALSGGGIRSATFNLGLLQGLNDLKVLGLLDYLSTVSGGGYIGGWWTAFCTRQARAGQSFPVATGGHEANEVRHLREFSNFLAPRLGFFEVETWNALVSILVGMLFSLLATLAVVTVGLLGWSGLQHLASQECPHTSALAVTLIPCFVFVVFEGWWWHDKSAERASRRPWFYGAIALSTLVLVWVLWGCLRPSNSTSPTTSLWTELAGLLQPCLPWLASAALLAVLRFCISGVSCRFHQPGLIAGVDTLLEANDRVLGRLVATAAAWAALALIWWTGDHLRELGDSVPFWVGGGAAASGTAMVTLRHWIAQQAGKVIQPQIWLAKLKPLLPTILSYLALVLTFILVAMGLQQKWACGYSGWIFVLAVAIIIITLLAFDPERIGMHAFYRARITRAYLGASNPNYDPNSNRETDVRRADDVPLDQALSRPLHLICCAANDLGGDHVVDLGRGACSAVLSPFGSCVRHDWRETPDLMMSSALTASAAAFNSNMGSQSMRMGPAVRFLMTALNLRLGLWLPDGSGHGAIRHYIPGGRFFMELFGLTKAPAASEHLSDGAHFENLGLYELVRRHCRYIIVSDCGADPDVSFEDFANAQRRIRADFGVEVEIDLDPLRPGPEGYARQHMVVGTINYNRINDKGILLYFKPSLTGDEPRDILEYKGCNTDFPHESTGDQFYDEAQWESYRRLGEHAARAALRFTEQSKQSLTPSGLFTQARWQWYAAPADLAAGLLAAEARLVAFERDLAKRGLSDLVREMFPELQVVVSPAAGPSAPGPGVASDSEATLHVLIQALRVMEEIWLLCHLATHWNHPQNMGWMNLFQRWTSTASFRLWWPFLKGLSGQRFRDFMQQRFPLSATLPQNLVKIGPAAPVTPATTSGLAWRAWELSCGGPPPIHPGTTIYTCEFTPSVASAPIQVALLALEISSGTARWASGDFVVAAGLWASGIGGLFARAVMGALQAAPHLVQHCEVQLPPGPPDLDEGSRQERYDLLAFYGDLGFRLSEDGFQMLLD